MIFLLFLLLTGCSSKNIIAPIITPPIITQPIIIELPNITDKYYEEAISETTKIRDIDLIEVRAFYNVIEYVPIYPQAINPISGIEGFYLNEIPNVPSNALNVYSIYPNSYVNNKLLVQGYTNLFTPGRIFIYYVSTKPEVKVHENLHVIWWFLFTDEICSDGKFIWEVVEHNISCDPFKKVVE